MELPVLPKGVTDRTWLAAILINKLPRILLSLAVVANSCAHRASKPESAHAGHGPRRTLSSVIDVVRPSSSLPQRDDR
jgi:hypothetical protein